MGEMEDEIEGEALYSESPDTTADDSSPDAFDAMVSTCSAELSRKFHK